MNFDFKFEEIQKNWIINYLGLQAPIYKKTTNYGHFGKPELSWEKVIKI